MAGVYVKGHRRGKSVVRAYARTISAIKSVERRAYRGGGALTVERQKQYYGTLKVLENRKDRMNALLRGKFDVGGALLGGRRRRAGFVGSKLDKR